ncbi:DUF308 domain-containing protein [uncultured Planktosalinus sp.]|uniref:DUF308 domain-containing protein n=1 Tax=uncultured Planktosalinus sp. TaxID=1810935 RepID=UPI0030DD2A91
MENKRYKRYIWLALILIALLVISIYAAMNPVFPYNYIIWGAGFVLLLIGVIYILQTKRKSNKTFKDWYEDNPRNPK